MDSHSSELQGKKEVACMHVFWPHNHYSEFIYMDGICN